MTTAAASKSDTGISDTDNLDIEPFPTHIEQSDPTRLAPSKSSDGKKPQTLTSGHDSNGSQSWYQFRPTVMSPSLFAYCVGGCLAWDDPSYVERSTDKILIACLKKQQFAYVLGPRQIGKSSLRVHVRHKMDQQGYRCVTVQATQLSASKSNASESNWCSSLMATICTDLQANELALLLSWLPSTADLPPVERLSRFVEEFLAEVLSIAPVVIFIDEIEALTNAAFETELFQWIAKCYELRQTHTLYRNLNFVVLGSAIAADLPQPGSLFSAGCEISLPPFQQSEAYALSPGLQNKAHWPTVSLDAIEQWTYGHPFLTQKLCHLMSQLLETLVHPAAMPMVLSTAGATQWVDKTVRSHIIEDWQTKDDPVHLRAISDRINHSFNRTALLNLYKKVLSKSRVNTDNSYIQAELILSGLVIVENDQLKVANKIYQQVFTLK